MTSPEVSVCTNIGPAERRKRFMFGIGLLGSTLALFVLLLDDQQRWLRLMFFVPWALGALAVFQALDSTCVALAARGLRNMDGREERVSDAESAALRQRARRIYVKAVAAAALALIATLLI